MGCSPGIRAVRRPGNAGCVRSRMRARNRPISSDVIRARLCTPSLHPLVLASDTVLPRESETPAVRAFVSDVVVVSDSDELLPLVDEREEDVPLDALVPDDVE